jgi:hypothetical protein
MKRGAPVCNLTGCGKFSQAVVTSAPNTPIHLCAEHAAVAANIAEMLLATVDIQPEPCVWCSLPIAFEDRAEREEPLHRDCVEDFEDQTDILPTH